MPDKPPRRGRRRFAFGADPRSEIDEEFAAHLEHASRELAELGMEPRAALEEASRRFGDPTRYRLACYEIDRRRHRARRRGELMNDLIQDARFTFRAFRRSPGFVAGALLTLALAIGANAAIFTVANSLLLEPLPFPAADRLIQVQRTFPDGIAPTTTIRHFLYWRDQSQVFAGMAAYDNLSSGFNLAGEGLPERVVGSRVSRDFLSVFGVKPTLGRDFLPEEGRPGGRRAVILSDGLWSRRFGSERAVLGRQIRLNGESYTVVGVMPRFFRFPAQAELWTPVQMDPASREKADYLEVTGRLKPGVTPARAAAAMTVVARHFAAAEPDMVDSPKESVILVPLRERLYGGLKTRLLVLLGVVGCVLMVACVNVGNLQLARWAARARELAIRTALGAGARRLAGQLLTESLLLALLGGAAGLLVAYWGLRPLLALSPLDLHPLVPIHVDGAVLAFTLGVSLLCGLLFGLLPALQAGRADLNEALKEGSGRATSGVRGASIRRALVVAQVALALVPVILAIQLVKGFAGLLGTDPGFAADHLLTMKLSLPAAKYGDPAAFERFARRVREQVEAIPGVRAAVFASSLPTEPGGGMPFTIEGKYQGKGSKAGVGRAEYRAVDAGFLAALRVPVLGGRPFGERDGRGGELVALVNETASHHFWPGEEPVGKRISVGQPYVPDLADPTPRTIVGVVKDVRELGVQRAAPAILYVPLAQVPMALQRVFLSVVPMSFLVRTTGDPPGLAAAVKRAVWVADPEQPVTDIAKLDEVVSRSLGSERFAAVLLGLLAAMVLTLAAVGIYGVLSFLVGQRTREIGVRMAFGATRRRVLWLFIRQGTGPVLLGVTLGLAAASALAHVLAHLLAGVSAEDPLTFVLGPVLLIAVALLASSLPARRASRLDPAVALRKE